MRLYVFCLALCAAIAASQACSCMPMDARSKYCESDFFAEVKVTSNMKNPSGNINQLNAFYNIRMLKLYRLRNLYSLGTVVSRLYTAGNSAMCGVTLERRKYMVSGSISSDGKLRIMSCMSIIDQSPYGSDVMGLRSSPPRCPILTIEENIALPEK